jgi:hypothetical protein
MIFAREVSDPLTSLVKQIDSATALHADKKMGSFVVVLSDTKNLDKNLADLAKKEKIEHTVLSIDTPEGPKGYKVDKDADVTVVLYVKRNVKVNHAFHKGELTASGIDKIMADLPKILTSEPEEGGPPPKSEIKPKRVGS